jgi:hypothetical protein
MEGYASRLGALSCGYPCADRAPSELLSVRRQKDEVKAEQKRAGGEK